VLADAAGEITQTFSKKCFGSDMDCGGAETHFVNIWGLALCPFAVLGIPFECNHNDNVWREDHLTLIKGTNLTPLKSLMGGDSGDPGEISYYQIGKLFLR